VGDAGNLIHSILVFLAHSTLYNTASQSPFFGVINSNGRVFFFLAFLMGCGGTRTGLERAEKARKGSPHFMV
jgi:hypothetical protein